MDRFLLGMFSILVRVSQWVRGTVTWWVMGTVTLTHSAVEGSEQVAVPVIGESRGQWLWLIHLERYDAGVFCESGEQWVTGMSQGNEGVPRGRGSCHPVPLIARGDCPTAQPGANW